jgi:hypothetical protein
MEASIPYGSPLISDLEEKTGEDFLFNRRIPRSHPPSANRISKTNPPTSSKISKTNPPTTGEMLRTNPTLRKEPVAAYPHPALWATFPHEGGKEMLRRKRPTTIETSRNNAGIALRMTNRRAKGWSGFR